MRYCEIKNGKYVSVDIYSVINKNGAIQGYTHMAVDRYEMNFFTYISTIILGDKNGSSPSASVLIRHSAEPYRCAQWYGF